MPATCGWWLAREVGISPPGHKEACRWLSLGPAPHPSLLPCWQVVEVRSDGHTQLMKCGWLNGSISSYILDTNSIVLLLLLVFMLFVVLEIIFKIGIPSLQAVYTLRSFNSSPTILIGGGSKMSDVCACVISPRWMAHFLLTWYNDELLWGLDEWKTDFGTNPQYVNSGCFCLILTSF